MKNFFSSSEIPLKWKVDDTTYYGSNISGLWRYFIWDNGKLYYQCRGQKFVVEKSSIHGLSEIEKKSTLFPGERLDKQEKMQKLISDHYYRITTKLHTAIEESSKGYEGVQTIAKLINKTNLEAKNICGMTPLHMALVVYNSIEVAKILLKAGASVRNQALLHNAIYNKDLVMVKFLLEHRADLNEKDNFGDTPLNGAFRERNEEIIQLLLDKGVDTNIANNRGEVPLHLIPFVKSDKKIPIFKSLLDKGANPNLPDQKGATPLHKVVQDDIELVKLLLAAKANTNLPDQEGDTPLHKVVRMGDSHIEVVKLLLAAKANTNYQNKKGETPLVLAIRSTYYDNNLQVIKLLLDNTGESIKNEGSNLLDIAANPGTNKPSSRVIKLLMAAKFNPSKCKDGGTAILNCAIDNGDSELFQSALAAGVKLDDKQTLLKTVVLKVLGKPDDKNLQNSCEKIIELLLNMGVNLNVIDQHKFIDLLHFCISRNNTKMVELLLRSKDDPNYRTGPGIHTPLQVAAQHNSVETAAWLLAKGANLEVRDFNNEETPLHIAAKNGNTNIVQFFLNKKANFEAKTKEGSTALHYAASQGHAEIVKSLLNAGADPETTNKNGDKPLNLATNSEVVLLLQSARTNVKGVSSIIPQNQQKMAHTQTVQNKAVENFDKLIATLEISFSISSKELEFDKELGQGGFGIVYKGTFRHSDVAIKKLKAGDLSEKTLKEFQSEMKIMARLRSPNIVQLYGITKEKPYCIVMEYMPKGDLYNLLHSNAQLSREQKAQIALDIARGLAYLHAENIMHRDLKSKNILLDENLKAKIGDLGLAIISREVSTTSSTGQIVGTLAWIAPEIILGEIYTLKADIYSFGVILWELSARETPFSKANGNQVLIATWKSMGKKDEIPKDTPTKLAKLIEASWAQKPEDRPNAEQAVQQLQTRASVTKSNEYRSNIDSTSRDSDYRDNFDSEKSFSP